MQIRSLCHSVCELARETALFLKKDRAGFNPRELEVKGHNDFVTRLDKESETRLIEGLGKFLPGSGFLGEEGMGNISGKEFTWIIDPLDGTTNYIHGVPCYSVSVALEKEGQTIMGVVYDPSMDECFYAHEGADAMMNGKKISVSDHHPLSACLMATGYPQADYSRLEPYIRSLQDMMKNCRGIRRPGSAAIDLAWIAAGRFDGFWEYSLKPWDVAAGAYLIQKAGGKVTDFKGGENFVYGKEIVAGNQKSFGEILQIVQKHL